MIKIKQLELYEKLTIILCLSFFIVLVVISGFHEMGGYGVETDFYGAYAKHVEDLLSGQQYKGENHGPGYIYVLTIFKLMFNDVFTAGKFLTIISSLLFAYFIFKIFKSLFEPKLAFFTVVLLWIIILPFSILAANDLFFAFLISLSIYLIYRNDQLSASNFFWGGVAAGYAYMTRMNALILPLAVILLIVFINPQRWQWKIKVKTLAIFTTAFILAASPWLIMNTINLGNPLASQAHQVIGASMLKSQSTGVDFAWGAEEDAIGEAYDSLLVFVFSNFTRFAMFFMKNIYNNFKALLLNLIRFPAYLFLAPGAVLLFSRISRKQLSLFFFPLFGFLIYCVFTFLPRWYIYVAPFFLFFVVYFLFYNDLERESSAKRFLLINKAILVLIIIFLLNHSLKELKYNVTSEPLELLKISQVLREDSNNSDIMIARKPHLAYLSNMNVTVFPDVNSVDELLQYANEQNATYLLYSDVESQLRPNLKLLQHPEKLPPDLQLFYSQDNPKIFIYKIQAQ